MKNKQLKFSNLKKDLHFRKNKGQKYIIWSLTKEQLDFVVSLGYNVKVELYQITTRQFLYPKNVTGILKDIHYAKRNGRKTIVRKLKKSELKSLDEYNIKYYPIKYKIYL